MLPFRLWLQLELALRTFPESSRGQCGNAEASSIASRKALAIFTWKCLPWKLNYIWDFGFPLPQPPLWEVSESYCGDHCNQRLSAFQHCWAGWRTPSAPGPGDPVQEGKGSCAQSLCVGRPCGPEETSHWFYTTNTHLQTHTYTHPIFTHFGINSWVWIYSWSGSIWEVCFCLWAFSKIYWE